jgi:hypothetical protein
MTGIPTAFGKDKCKEWKIDGRCYFDKNGSWYVIPQSFPAALCDPNGYVYFKTENDLKNCTSVVMGVRLHVKGGISKLPFYRKMP